MSQRHSSPGGWHDDERQVLEAAQLPGFTIVDQPLASLGDMPLRIIVLQRPRFDPSAAAGWRL